MTPMFDEFDKELRQALASEALPPDGFADRVMARVCLLYTSDAADE